MQKVPVTHNGQPVGQAMVMKDGTVYIEVQDRDLTKILQSNMLESFEVSATYTVVEPEYIAAKDDDGFKIVNVFQSRKLSEEEEIGEALKHRKYQ